MLQARNPAQAALFTCYNPNQSDIDGDGFGDTCDTCPWKPSNVLTEQDPDHDLVGDECDDCSDTANPVDSCVPSADPRQPFSGCWCVSIGRGIGRCVSPADWDQDDRQDACDNCLGVYNPPQSNTNDAAEVSEIVEALGDECDPVPVHRKHQQTDSIWYYDTPAQGEQVGPLNATRFKGPIWLGSGADDSDVHLDDMFFRYCSCLQNGVPLNYFECTMAKQYRRCDAGWADDTVLQSWNHFREVTVRSTGSPNPTTRQMPYHISFKENRASSSAGEFTWNWYQDVVNGIESYETTFGETLVKATHGVMASIIEHNLTPRTSDRDQSSSLRISLTMFETPGYVSRKFPAPPDHRPNQPVPSWPWMVRQFQIGYSPINPEVLIGDMTPGILENLDGVGWVYVPANDPRPLPLDVADELQTALWAAYLPPQDADFAYLPPSEPGSHLEALGGPVVGAVLSRNPRSPRAVIVENREGRLQPVPLAPLDELLSDDMHDLAAVSLPPGGQAAFSARERAIYVVGGTVGGSTGLVRRYLPDSGVWEPVGLTDFEPGTTVLATTYDSASHRLFVLDLDPNGNSARLVVHDAREPRPSSLLLAVPFKKAFLRYMLVLEPTGNVDLVGMGESTVVWRLDAAGHVLGARVIGRAVVGAPQWESAGLTLAISHGDSMEYQVVLLDDFTDSAPLDYL